MTEKTYWIGTGWKMNKSLAEASAFADALKAADADRDDRIQRFVLPPFTLLRVKHFGDRKIGVRVATTARQHTRPKAEFVKIDLAIDEIDFSGVDIVGLQVLVGPVVKACTMRAGV